MRYVFLLSLLAACSVFKPAHKDEHRYSELRVEDDRPKSAE